MKTWEVFFDNQDAQVAGRVDRVGDRLREEAGRQSEPVVERVEREGLTSRGSREGRVSREWAE